MHDVRFPTGVNVWTNILNEATEQADPPPELTAVVILGEGCSS
jgi:hypothetical protein